MINKEPAAKARSYFLKPGFRRMLTEIWRKYASLEKLGGHARLLEATAEECEAINAFFGWNYKVGDNIKIPLVLFERELQGSAFPYRIIELHEVLTGKPLLTKSDRVWIKQEKWSTLFREVQLSLASEELYFLHPQLVHWLERLQQGTAAGYRMLQELMRESSEAAKQALTVAARALLVLYSDKSDTGIMRESQLAPIQLQLPTIRLPVLAAHVSGDAHALDRNMPAGRLFFQALKERTDGMSDEGLASAASEAVLSDDTAGLDSLVIRDIYRKAGVADDDISSFVHMYDPIAEDGGRQEDPVVLTLRQVEATARFRPVSDLFILENPAVFSTLMDKSGSTDEKYGLTQKDMLIPRPLLLCTSGPASAAALRLIDRMIECCSLVGNIYYSGDFDIRGIEMGHILAVRYGARFRSWRFNSDAYIHGIESSVHKLGFTEGERERLRKMKVLWDEWLADQMAKQGEKLFQEQFVALLADDWLKALGE